MYGEEEVERHVWWCWRDGVDWHPVGEGQDHG